MATNIIEALNWRYAVRKFSAERIAEERIQDLLTATRLSATSYGLQPYRLVMVNSRETREKLLPHSYGQEKVLQCSHLVIFAAQKSIGDTMVNNYIHSVSTARGVPESSLQGLADHMKGVFAGMDSRQRREWAHQQAHIALGTLLTAAAAMKIDTCPMGGIEPAGYDSVLNLETLGLETSVICALGIRHPEDTNSNLKKVRYDASEMVLTL